jgi:hypothetical protein
MAIYDPRFKRVLDESEELIIKTVRAHPGAWLCTLWDIQALPTAKVGS